MKGNQKIVEALILSQSTMVWLCGLGSKTINKSVEHELGNTPQRTMFVSTERHKKIDTLVLPEQ